MNSPANSNETELQRRYYADTAGKYDRLHLSEKGEHDLALCWMVSLTDFLEIKSILDIGSGTGRTIAYLKNKRSDIEIIGIEPVEQLRRVGYSKEISENELIDGDATNLQFEDGRFDLVCEFGVLHHIKKPEAAVSEMLRIAKKAIFISDSNNFGQGSQLSRATKQLINSFGLWKLADLINTKGKGYSFSENDGLAYSYSVFNNYKQIREQCKSVHLLNTKDGGYNPYRTTSHVALLGIKK